MNFGAFFPCGRFLIVSKAIFQNITKNCQGRKERCRETRKTEVIGGDCDEVSR
jgi:hypothetical protein